MTALLPFIALPNWLNFILSVQHTPSPSRYARPLRDKQFRLMFALMSHMHYSRGVYLFQLRRVSWQERQKPVGRWLNTLANYARKFILRPLLELYLPQAIVTSDTLCLMVWSEKRQLGTLIRKLLQGCSHNSPSTCVFPEKTFFLCLKFFLT